MTKKISGIYLIKNKLNNKCYVGVSIDIYSRWRQHKYWAKNKGVVSRITNSIRKHGIENFEFSIIEQCDKEFFEEKERFWIDSYDSVSNGYNLTYGGNLRKILSEETKLKMSKSRTGVAKSKEHRANLVASIKSIDVRKKISHSLKGRKITEETKKKMSLAKVGKKRDTSVGLLAAQTKRREFLIASSYLHFQGV